MELLNTYIDEGFPFHGRKLKKMKEFLTRSNLDYDPAVTYSVMLCKEDGQVIGCGSRHENILKCIAIDESFQGEGLLQKIVTGLINQAYASGFSHLFLFTKPEYRIVFGDMGFYPVTSTESMLLLENRKNGILHYIEEESGQFSSDEPKDTGAIVMNANPFTLGHRYLIETAAKSCPLLHVFVLSEDASEFPASVRLELVKKGCSDLKNVIIHGSSDYLISHATFPDYFLKDKASASDKAAQLDLKIFLEYFKDGFHIKKRFVGEEPFSPVTRAYNEQMKEMLPSAGIEVIEIPRKASGETIISATLVRKKFLENDLASIRTLVPETTYEYLISPQGQELRNKLLEKTL